MNIKAALGLEAQPKIRYAIVGLGDIAQEDMMPGVKHTGNSVITALVTDNSEKAQKLGAFYQVESTFTYEEFDRALASGTFDAIYLATPNWRHAEFIVPALRAGIHVLTEKPLEVSTAKCQEILDVAHSASAKLMVAYRLHFEPGTLSTIETIRSGQLGEVHTFTSTFAQPLDPSNHRAHSGDGAGPLLDMGPYAVNAARYIFGAEPEEVVSAVGIRHPDSGFDQDFDDTVMATLRFPGSRLAQFTVSYYGGPIDTFLAVGPKGCLMLSPSYSFGEPIEQTLTIGQDKKQQSFKATDHFGGEMKYFSDCILQGTEVEPDGEEGFADIRVLEGILEALKTGGAVKLSPFIRTKRIDTTAQKMELKAVAAAETVGVANPTKGSAEHAPN